MNNLATDIYADYRAKLAFDLDESEEHCWADLVSFMADGDKEMIDPSSGNFCRNASKTHPDKTCWCGKFFDGKTAKETARDE